MILIKLGGGGLYILEFYLDQDEEARYCGNDLLLEAGWNSSCHDR
jgi:hypothetical protein